MTKKGSIAVFIIMAFLLLRENVPFISSKIPTSIFITVLFISYSILLKYGRTVLNKYILLFCIPIVDTVAALLGYGNRSFAIMGYSFLQLFIWAYVCEYIKNNSNDKYLKYTGLVLIVSVLVTAVTTYFGCLLYPGASRDLATGLIEQDRQNIYSNLNIGGFGFIYILTLLLPVSFNYLRFKSDNLLHRILAVVVLFIFCLAIYGAEYTTALLFSALSIVILFLPQKLSRRNVFYLFVIYIPIVLLSIKALPSLLSYFSNTTSSYEFSIRLEEMEYMMSGGQGYGDAQGRINVWSVSWNNFINNLLTGVGNRGGGHSYILDTLSMYGIWGLLLIIMQFVSLYKVAVKPYVKTNYYTLFIFVYIVHLFLCLFNTEFFYSMFLVYLPFYVQINQDKKNYAPIEYSNNGLYHNYRNIP